MKITVTKVKTVKKIKETVWLMSFDAPNIAQKAVAGQFLHIKPKSTVLRRPLSIHNVNKNTVEVLFKLRGRGTLEFSRYRPGQELDILGPLGKGFSLPKNNELKSIRNILVAGGIGVAPLLFLARTLKHVRSPGHKVTSNIIIGARNKEEILCVNEFKRLGYKVLIATDDGSLGVKGNAIDLLKKDGGLADKDLATNIYCCGPEPMFKPLYEVVKDKPNINCQVSFEQFMGCGVGTCCGCTIETKNGYKKVCKDGPVFDINNIF